VNWALLCSLLLQLQQSLAENCRHQSVIRLTRRFSQRRRCRLFIVTDRQRGQPQFSNLLCRAIRYVTRTEHTTGRRIEVQHMCACSDSSFLMDSTSLSDPPYH